MFSLRGAPALSQFRLDGLAAALRELEPRVRAIEARFVHFVDADGPLADDDSALLARLLTYGPRADGDAARPPRPTTAP